MPMIDADALMTELNDTKYAWQDYDAVEDALRNIPTIEADPVRHGRWDYYSTTMQECSVCKRHTPRHRYTFCPNCGARMDGDADEDLQAQ